MRRLLIAVSIVLSTTCTVAALVILASSHDLPVPDSWGFRGFATIFAFTFTWAGANLTWRRPKHAVGWVLLQVGVVSATQAFLAEYSIAGTLGRPTPLPGAVFAAWIVSWLWLTELTLVGGFLLSLFPDGHFLSWRWRIVAWFGAMSAVVGALALAFRAGPLMNATFADNPFPLYDDADQKWFYAAMGGVGLASLGGAASLFVRYRRSRGVERQQLKWLAFEAIILAVAVLVGSFDQTDKWASVFLIAAIALVPVMVGVAVLRYHLYDVDVVINRAIVYGLTTAAIGTTFFAGIVVLQALLRPLTGGSEVAVAASTLLCFALFQPVRRRVGSTVDRRFYRARYDAARTLDRFATELTGEVDLGAVRASLLAVVGETLQPSQASVWLRPKPSGPVTFR